MRYLIFFCLSFILFSSCEMMGVRQVKGNGIAGSEQRTAASFNQVEASGPIDILISQGAPSVRVEAEQNLLEFIVVENRGNTLYVHLRNNISLNMHRDAKVYISTPSLRMIKTNGSGDISSEGRISGDGLEVNMTGSGNLALDLDMPQVKVQLQGSGDAQITGLTRNFNAQIQGSGNINAFGLKAEETNIRVQGSGDAEVFASKLLDINIQGSGDVHYKGGANVHATTHGSGSAQKAE